MAHNPEGRIFLQPSETRVTVAVSDTVIADTRTALVLDERGYPPRFYIPRADIDSQRLLVADKHTHCPFKGDATYYHVQLDDEVLADAAWCYETPFAAMADIAGYVAFDHPGLRIVRD